MNSVTESANCFLLSSRSQLPSAQDQLSLYTRLSIDTQTHGQHLSRIDFLIWVKFRLSKQTALVLGSLSLCLLYLYLYIPRVGK